MRKLLCLAASAVLVALAVAAPPAPPPGCEQPARPLPAGAVRASALPGGALPGGAQPPGGPQPAQVNVELTVLRHQNVQAFTKDQVKAVFDEMGKVLQVVDGPGDVACSVSFAQKGKVGIFTGPNVISTQGDFNAIANLGSPYHIKVVSTIDWCGAFMPSAVACSPVGIAGTSIVVEEDFFLDTVDLSGVIMVHEYGHNRGLSHRSGTNTLMNASVGPGNRAVNGAESAKFLVPPVSAVLVLPPPGQPAAAVIVDPLAAPVPEEPEEELPPVQDFVRKVHEHGVPYEKASRYKKADAETLLKMLADPKEMKWWTNIATTIAFIGDASALDQLIAFAQKPPALKLEAPPTPKQQRQVFDARKAAVGHMGVIVKKTDNNEAKKKALDFLAAVAQADAATVKQFTELPKTPEGPGMIGPIPQLALAAVEGLAVSGQPEAAKALKQIRAQESPAVEAVRGVLEKAIQTNEDVQKHGLDAYFGKSHKH